MGDQTLGMIWCWPLSYAPAGWAFCAGQILQIQDNQALYSLIGNMYGGDGKITFALPDLRSRIAVCAGTNKTQGINYQLAQTGGSETVTLTADNIPPHAHSATPVTGEQNLDVTGTLTVSGVSASSPTPSATNPAVAGGYSSATDAFGNNVNIWNFAPAATNMVTLPAALNIQLNNPANAVTLQPSGGGEPHPNIQPYLALNFIICVNGLYPNRPS